MQSIYNKFNFLSGKIGNSHKNEEGKVLYHQAIGAF